MDGLKSVLCFREWREYTTAGPFSGKIKDDFGKFWEVGIIGMYGPPQSCKRKTKNGSWSAPMYSAFSGVIDSGP